MNCPHCQSENTVKNGKVKLQDQSFQQRYLCQGCKKRFNERTKAKRVEGLQRVLDVQQLIHNWVRLHWGLGRKLTPAMAMGYCQRPLSIAGLLTLCGFDDLTR